MTQQDFAFGRAFFLLPQASKAALISLVAQWGPAYPVSLQEADTLSNGYKVYMCPAPDHADDYYGRLPVGITMHLTFNTTHPWS